MRSLRLSTFLRLENMSRPLYFKSMRRLAKQDRKDNYASRRDYQRIVVGDALRVRAKTGLLSEIELSIEGSGGSLKLFGGGGYLRPSKSVGCSVRLSSGLNSLSQNLNLAKEWSRIGLALEAKRTSTWVLKIQFTSPLEYVDVWGLTIGPIKWRVMPPN